MSYKFFMIGMWHLGCVTAGCLNHLKHQITCFDYDPMILDKLSKKELPIFEKDLSDKLFDDKVVFTNEFKGISDVDFIFITYDIEANGITHNIIDRIIKDIKPYVNQKHIVVVRSQVSVGVCDKIQKELGCDVCYFPENLRLGVAVQDFLNPNWLVFGSSSMRASSFMRVLFEELMVTKIFLTLKEAEMMKLTMNAYLATMIMFSGDISDICEKYKIDARKVIGTIKLDRRVSPSAPIMPGLGLGGGTIIRDVRTINKLNNNIVLDAVQRANDKRSNYVEQKLQLLLGNLEGKTIAIFGLTYKYGTNTLRDSISVKLIHALFKQGVRIKAFDPMVKSGVANVLFIEMEQAKDVDAIVIMNDWEGFKTFDYSTINPKILFDTTNLLPEDIPHYGIGVHYE